MAVFDLILIALAVALEPIPLTGFMLILSAERGTAKGAGFIFGWVLSLVVVVGTTVAATDGKPPRPATAPSTAILAVKGLIGLGLLGVAYRRRSRIGLPKKPPTWMKKLDHLSPLATAGVGAGIQPWVLVAAGAATVAQLSISSVATWLLLVLYCLLCTASFLAMELLAVFSPEATAARLLGVRAWIDAHRDQAIIVLSLVVGLWLLGHSLYLMASS